jgi:hypothetical protein
MEPITISETTDRFDGGFLRHHFTRFVEGKPLDRPVYVEGLCRTLCLEHDRLLKYHVNVDGQWTVSNYSLEDINYDPEKFQIRGRLYHVTGFDGTEKDGNDGTLFQVSQTKKEKKQVVVPLLVTDKNKKHLGGLFINERYPDNDYEFKSILVGNKYALMEMPRFRGRGSNYGLALIGN